MMSHRFYGKNQLYFRNFHETHQIIEPIENKLGQMMKGYAIQLTKNYFSHYMGLHNLVWQGIILSLIESIFIGIYYFLPLYFIKEFNYTLALAGFVITFYGFGTILGGFIGGKLSDLYTSKVVSVSSLLGQSGIFLLLIFTKQQIFLTLLVFFMGFFSYTFITSINLWVLQQCENNPLNVTGGGKGQYPGRKLQAINLLNVASNVGLSISAIIMGFYVGFNFYIIFILGAIVLFAIAVYFLFLPGGMKQPADFEIEEFSKDIFLRNPLKKMKFLLILSCTLCMGFIIFQTNTTYAIYLQECFPEYGMKGLSYLFTLNCLIVVFFQTQLVAWFGKFNHIIVMGIGALLIGLGTMVLNFSYFFFIAVLSCIVYTIGEMIFCSISQLLAYEYGKNTKKGNNMGIYRSVYAISRVSAPALGTQIFQNYGANLLWYLCGILGVLCWVFCTWISQIDKSS